MSALPPKADILGTWLGVGLKWDKPDLGDHFPTF